MHFVLKNQLKAPAVASN